MNMRLKKRSRAALAWAVTFILMLTCIFPAAKTYAAAVNITNVEVTEVSAAGYRVTAKITAPAGIHEVLMPTWTKAGGQDDLVWHTAAINGQTATFYIESAAHKGEAGEYITHIYAYDWEGNYALTGTGAILGGGSGPSSGTEPAVGTVFVTELTSQGYRVTADIMAGAGVREVLMPTWTKANGQDDLIWHKAAVSSGKATFYVDKKDHGNETGAYITHIYLYDSQNRYALKGVDVTVPGENTKPQELPAPVIENITAAATPDDGFLVTAKISAPAGVREVLMPTWSAANGQDDLVWHKAAVTGNEASFYVKISDHKGELGEYITHVYLYDMKDRLDLKGVTVVVGTAKPVDESPKIQNVQISEVSQTGYRVTAQISAPAGVKEVLMPTWTSANGQDDLIWHKAEVSGNTASVYIYTADHRNEGGTYITHIYLTDSKNRTVIVGTGAEVPWRQAPPAGHIVCLDAGHQAYGIATLEPNGPGSSVMKAKLSSGTAGVATGVAERDLNLTIALKLKAELIARGYQVVMIRETNDCTLSNAERAVVANNSGAEIFVRIHANSSANPAVSGAMFYAPSTANPFMTGNVINGSINLAQIMLNSFCAATGAVNRGLLLDDTMTGINWCTIPVTIAEMGFMSNPDEDIRMQDPAYQARMVQGLANGIDGYFGIVR